MAKWSSRSSSMIFTAALSRHLFVWLTYSQTQSAVIAGCEPAWRFFGGVFWALIPDNLTPGRNQGRRADPWLSAGWLDDARHVGFGARSCPSVAAYSPSSTRSYRRMATTLNAAMCGWPQLMLSAALWCGSSDNANDERRTPLGRTGLTGK